ncbi:hypothetical protein FRB99_005603 [Tulasnella sp. 403]|nr:hypothetical protein FRB99_005603 [Tulasnella sp. 403]
MTLSNEIVQGYRPELPCKCDPTIFGSLHDRLASMTQFISRMARTVNAQPDGISNAIHARSFYSDPETAISPIIIVLIVVMGVIVLMLILSMLIHIMLKHRGRRHVDHSPRPNYPHPSQREILPDVESYSATRSLNDAESIVKDPCPPAYPSLTETVAVPLTPPAFAN